MFYGADDLSAVEKVHIVWGPVTGTRRMKSPIYLLCLATMLGYGVIIILMFIGRNAYIRESGRCVIGLKHYATIPLISYDLCVLFNLPSPEFL
jgi:hypothetical protein